MRIRELGHTKISAAWSASIAGLPLTAPIGLDACCCDQPPSILAGWSRKGLRDTGLSEGVPTKPGLSDGELAPLRNGLFEDRLRVSPGESRFSVTTKE